MITILLACKQKCWMLVLFQVSWVSIWVWKLTITCFLYVSVMANSQISSTSKCRAEIGRVEYCSFLIHELHFLFKSDWEQERLFFYICMDGIVGRFPGNRCETTDDFIELGTNKYYCVSLSIAVLMESLHWKIVVGCAIKHFCIVNFHREHFFYEWGFLFCFYNLWTFKF